MKFIRTAIALLMVLSISACAPRPTTVAQDTDQQEGKLLVMLVDFSNSTAEQREERLARDVETVLGVLDYGDTVIVSEIVDDSRQNAEVIYEERLPLPPRPDFAGIDNQLVRRGKCEEFKKRLAQFKKENSLGDFRAEVVESIGKHKHEATATDIFGALEFAARFFDGGPDEKMLALFSDMVIETEKVSFTADELDPGRIEEIITGERDDRGLAALEGVDVFVIGARARQFLGVREFWFKYFAAARAKMDEKYYGNVFPATLLDSHTREAGPELSCD